VEPPPLLDDPDLNRIEPSISWRASTHGRRPAGMRQPSGAWKLLPLGWTMCPEHPSRFRCANRPLRVASAGNSIGIHSPAPQSFMRSWEFPSLQNQHEMRISEGFHNYFQVLQGSHRFALEIVQTESGGEDRKNS